MSHPHATRQRILASATDLIYARSYADVGVAEICRDAGVTKGSFYHFFAGKRELTLAVVEMGYVSLKQDLLDRAFVDDLAPMDRLRRFVDLSCRYQGGMFRETGRVPGCQFGNLAAEQATQDEFLRSSIDSVFDHLRAAFRDCLRDAVAMGETGAMDVDATAAAMLAYVEGVFLMAKTANDLGQLEQLLPAMLDIRIASHADSINDG